MSAGFRKPPGQSTPEAFVEAANAQPSAQNGESRTPWADAHPKVTVPLTLRLPEELHGKLTWLKEHMPNTSIQKIVRVAIEKEVESLLSEHYKS